MLCNILSTRCRRATASKQRAFTSPDDIPIETDVRCPPGNEWTAFFAVDPRQVRLTSQPGEIQIATMVSANGTHILTDTLFQLLEMTPLGWNWTLDVEAVGEITLFFLDSLLTIGHQLTLRGGSLRLLGLCIPDNLAPFAELFESRCLSHGITLAQCEDEGQKAPNLKNQDALTGRLAGRCA